MKKLSTLLTSVVLAFSLASCSQPSQPNSSQQPANTGTGTEASAAPDSGSQTADSKYSPPGELPIINEKITLSVFAPASPDIPRAESDMTKWMEEITNINIDWQTAASDAYNEKLQLTLASGAYPDMIVPGVGNRIDKSLEQQLGVQGIIIPLNDYYDTVSVGYKEAFDTMPGMREYITALDGNIYSMPNVDGGLHIQYANKLWINTYWLDNVGMEMPTTTEEFYNVLKAFKEQDANGNGDPNDEIPFSAAGSAELDVFLMNPFILTPAQNRMWIDDGNLVFSVMEPQYREGVRYLNKLYSEGLMNPELFTWNASTQINTNENGEEPVLGAVLGMRPGNFCDLSGYPDNSHKWEQYYPAAPFKGENGNATITNANLYANTFQTGVAMITSACKEPEAAFRMVDLLSTYEMSIISTNGPKGQGWRDATEGELNLDGEQAQLTIETFNRPENWGGWDQLMGRIQSPAYLTSLSYHQDPYSPDVDPMQSRGVVLYRGTLDYQKVGQPLESVLPPLFYENETLDELTLLETTINDYVNEMLVAFVTGKKNVDSDWDSYMTQLKTLGVERYMEIIQETYNKSSFNK